MERVRHVHLLGIGGCGMSAIAKILFEKGFTVSGSDVKESSNTIRLKDMGIKVYINHRRGNIRGADLVVVSTAISSDNVEEKEARLHGIHVCRRAEMLAWIMDQFKISIAVAGTHGKTTTTSMLAQLFLDLGMNPTFLIGGETDSVEGNARLGASACIIAEADESDGSFLILNPNLGVITNIEDDHLDHYGSLDEIKDAFKTFAKKLGKEGKLVINIDEKNSAALVKELSSDVPIYTYGLTSKADLYADDIVFSKGYSNFNVYHKEKLKGKVKLLVPGWQNILNALAAIYVGLLNNLDFSSMATSLQSFTGAKRRFQLIGEFNEIKIFDDYAHHPTEVKMTLQAAKLNYPGSRVVCVFQPHRYTRTLHLHKEFGGSFDEADVIIITDIYSAGEKPISGVSGKMIVDEIKKNGKEIVYLPRKEKIAEYLLDKVKKGDLVLVAGAGDINNVAKELYTRLRIKGNEDSSK
ncbi:MAG: UDP-N-acetylmuramate--L-alanine ligase [Candidatus Margulisbacteria bacterium]|nr:UDP-N-acetylmuramate--L-alanine ligase [Candidatus Margulisiibacteriota bacterium]MBU1022569.1 UDP-N-acetylmuramate--L-alanine ligase [Candidatus Margulisiibacteriota bacterium]MBU1728855.1 UDP-N-acetylmuramate--L-alanine ligase [Candidatus Margulisiibacteriota bacterium]MBU1955486.1 UDP-N-acetylmuramate--L-alanine ligase [Candidatus Margulisiibacteriota bacterium]